MCVHRFFGRMECPDKHTLCPKQWETAETDQLLLSAKAAARSRRAQVSSLPTNQTTS